jgi:predicted ATPase
MPMNIPDADADHAPTSPPVVGRARGAATLRAALDATSAGRGSLVLIGGEAGIGKTTLAEILLAEAHARGASVLVGHCYDLSETSPYGPWREAFGRVAGADLPPVLTGAEELAVASQATLHQQARDALAALATERPLVLLLDDLHWADPASLDLLRALARGLAELPILLLATYRADELTRRHPLYQLLPLLVREARAERLDVRPLDRSALLALVRISPSRSAGRRVIGKAGRAASRGARPSASAQGPYGGVSLRS